HAIARLQIPFANRDRQILLFLRGEQRRFVDFAQIGFQRRLNSGRRSLASFWHERFGLTANVALLADTTTIDDADRLSPRIGRARQGATAVRRMTHVAKGRTSAGWREKDR